jgi:hypothetical protein
MVDLQPVPAVDVSVLEILVMYDTAWFPPRIADVCEPMEELGLVERVGSQWRITNAGRDLIGAGVPRRH